MKQLNSNYRRMLQKTKAIQWTVQRSYYQVEFRKPNEILISVQDIDQRVKYLSIIDSDVLKDYSVDIQTFFSQMFRQYIYQNKSCKRMIKCQNGNISINTDFPRCQNSKYEFKCQKVITVLQEKTTNDIIMLRRMQAVQLKMDKINQNLQRLLEKNQVENNSQYEKSYRLLNNKLGNIIIENTTLLKEFINLKLESYNNVWQRHLIGLENKVRGDYLSLKTQTMPKFESLHEKMDQLNKKIMLQKFPDNKFAYTIETKTSLTMDRVDKQSEKTPFSTQNLINDEGGEYQSKYFQRSEQQGEQQQIEMILDQ